MNYVVVVRGIAGGERFLAQEREVELREQARKFRSDRAAIDAASDHLAQFAPVIQRQMGYRVEVA